MIENIQKIVEVLNPKNRKSLANKVAKEFDVAYRTANETYLRDGLIKEENVKVILTMTKSILREQIEEESKLLVDY